MDREVAKEPLNGPMVISTRENGKIIIIMAMESIIIKIKECNYFI